MKSFQELASECLIDHPAYRGREPCTCLGPLFNAEEKVRREIRERFALTGKKDD